MLLKNNPVVNAVGKLPCVSIILTTDPRWNEFRDTQEKLKSMIDEAKEQLLENYSKEKADRLIAKLNQLISRIDYRHLPKGLALYVSTTMARLYNLPFSVREKLVVEESFEVRDLLFAATHNFNYLVLVLSHKHARLLYGVNENVVDVPSNLPEHVAQFSRDVAEKVENYSDAADVKEAAFGRFLRKVDAELREVINQYGLPFFVLGVEEVNSSFKNMTKNGRHLLASIHGNYDHATPAKIYEALLPALQEWQQRKDDTAINLIKAAENDHKLTTGIAEIWKKAAAGNCLHLVVEKDYRISAVRADEFTIMPVNSFSNHPVPMNDAVDDVIELVMKFGGDVTFVEDGQLSAYKKIALITRY